MLIRSISCSCNLSWSSCISTPGVYAGFKMKVTILQQNAQRKVPRLTCCSSDLMILEPLYHNWQPSQHTSSREQPFPRMASQLCIWLRRPTSDAGLQAMAGPSAFRKSRYSCVVDPSCKDFPPIILWVNGPRFCSASICQNCSR